MQKHASTDFYLLILKTEVHVKRLICAAMLAAAVAACDKDPAAPTASLLLTCPAGPLSVNNSIALPLNIPVQPSTVAGGNVVVTNATTGVEVPGSLSLSPNGRTISFRPASPLPFNTVLAIRAQNILNAEGTTSLGVVVCNVLTEAAPIADLAWTPLPSAGGVSLLGATIWQPDSGWVASSSTVLFRRVASGWQPGFGQPYYSSSQDVDFISRSHGWGAHFDTRNLRGVITQTRNAGATFDTVFSIAGEAIVRLRIDSARTGKVFGFAGAGAFGRSTVLKVNPTTGSFAVAAVFNGRNAQVSDIDYWPTDTANVVAVSVGFKVDAATSFVYPGRLFRSTDGGASWSELTTASADTLKTITYLGVARRSNGDVYLAGGNGYFGRLANGATVPTKISLPVTSRDTLDFRALAFTDVQFAPDNDRFGWVVGAQQISVVNGAPQYRGLIFKTVDGGATWTRQGVLGAPDYGATFPQLNRLEVYSSTNVWIVGAGGYVLSLNP